VFFSEHSVYTVVCTLKKHDTDSYQIKHIFKFLTRITLRGVLKPEVYCPAEFIY